MRHQARPTMSYILLVIIYTHVLGTGRSSSSIAKRHVLIMDEVDGMAGNEDRGGMQVCVCVCACAHMCLHVCVHVYVCICMYMTDYACMYLQVLT